METYKLTEEEYDSLYSYGMSKQTFDERIKKINKRFEYIMKTVCKKLVWFDYDNGWENQDGFFQPNKYNKIHNSYITFAGEYKIPPPYDSCPEIPICWLWQDFEEEFKKEVEDEKKKREAEKLLKVEKNKKIKEQKTTLKQSILSKLTKEELKIIKFK